MEVRALRNSTWRHRHPAPVPAPGSKSSPAAQQLSAKQSSKALTRAAQVVSHVDAKGTVGENDLAGPLDVDCCVAFAM